MPALRFGLLRSGVLSCAAQLMLAIDETAPKAAIAGSTMEKGSGALRVSDGDTGTRGGCRGGMAAGFFFTVSPPGRTIPDNKRASIAVTLPCRLGLSRGCSYRASVSSKSHVASSTHNQGMSRP
ncbi:protein of unknown function [Candidatus Filomicrobium marinum]|uniref:Uncharacterized protein n=1 Tax=Candidatus Filomicrobium marinum TaxID=1608628 RepID=A0A0D6JCG8_9HYPH|nr:protein of unknown function [Candidatus Filomicrobium marinum]CPR17122.1 protein of unknown function [Candidatus Filomicrobium marinum]